jgi:divalent metal cation (Fe/Co/Zn/Cd) transporter
MTPHNKVQMLAVFTLFYNLIEGVVAVLFGYEDESLTLFGFGIDSFIESISAIGILAMITRLRRNPDLKRAEGERMALRITSVSFYLLVAGLLISTIIVMIGNHTPENTLSGLLLSVFSTVVMWLLIRAKTDVGNKLNSDAILADAQCGKVCLYMSLVLLASSGVYELTGFRYSDVIGAVGLSYFAYREGGECFDKAASDKLCSCDSKTA